MDSNAKQNRIKELNELECYVTQEGGTERPFDNKYWDNHEDGTYTCKVCGVELFDSKTKFDSGTGWPSFDRSMKDTIEYKEDTSHGMLRVEAVCKNCGAHLGHVFNDGPQDTTGKRYCINSASLDFKKEENQKAP